MTPTGEPRRGRWAFRAAVALYTVSFFLPVYGVLIGQPPYYGYEVFWDFRPNPAEWFYRPESIICDAVWTANVCMWVGCVSWVTGRPAHSLVSGVIGYLLAFTMGALFWRLFVNYPGYSVWLSSFFCLTVAGWKARPPAASGDD
jgi:hypothetical protein